MILGEINHKCSHLPFSTLPAVPGDQVSARNDCPIGQNKGHMCSGVSTKSDFQGYSFALFVFSIPLPLLFPSCFPWCHSTSTFWVVTLRHPAGPGKCWSNTQSCKGVLPGQGRTQRRAEVGSALREVYAMGSSLSGVKLDEGRPDSGSICPKRAIWACLWRMGHDFPNREGKGKSAWTKCMGVCCGPWRRCLSAPGLSQVPPSGPLCF